MKRRRYFSRKDNLKYTLLLGVVIALRLANAVAQGCLKPL
jgi:hypothetical protein